MLRKVGIRRTPMKPYRRKAEDKVPEWLFGYLLGRDKVCVPHKRLGAPGECEGRLTIEHVKEQAMVGKRAPSDKYHTLLACLGANTGWCLTSAAKAAERVYLAVVEKHEEAAIPPCPECSVDDIHFDDCPVHAA